jgi:site-specific DNA recombinase
MAWEKRGIAMHSATEPFDTGSAMGRHMLRIVLEFAHAEREVLLERIEAGRRRKAAGGGWNGGTVPFGFRRAPKASPKELVVEPAEAAVVKDLFRVYSTGRYSLAKAGALAGCPLSETAILELLANPVYTGKLRYHGTVRAARHDRIVSDRVFRRAREVRRMRSRGGVADSTKAVGAPTESGGACSAR